MPKKSPEVERKGRILVKSITQTVQEGRRRCGGAPESGNCEGGSAINTTEVAD